MSAYEPGTVAVATVRGVPNVRVMRTTGTGGGDDIWLSAEYLLGWRTHTAVDVWDVRPLVALDWHPNQSDLPKLLTLLRENYWTSLADQLEAQTKPPRIPEPGLWGVVEAWAGRIPIRRWVRHEEDWWVADTGDRLRWEDLNDPKPVRDGIEAAS